MSTNRVLIESKTVGAGGVASIFFTDIPQTYTDLLVKVSARMTSTYDLFWIRFNGVTTNLSGRSLQGDGSSAASYTEVPYGRVNNNGTTSNTFSSTDIYIANYAGSSYKSISVDSVSENSGTQAYTTLGAGLWSSTSAITSIQIVPNGGDTFVQYSTASLYGISNVTSTTKATGGIVSSDGTYNYHMFPYSGTFTPTQNITADYLVIAGGGGTGSDNGSGAGAGGVRSTTASLTAGTSYAVTVGAGGVGGAAPSNNGSKGNDSVFNGLTSTGGGLGAGGNLVPSNQDGGSGGGATGNYSGGNTTPAYYGGISSPATSPVQGYAGGNSYNTTAVGFARFSGGGGGAGAVGGNAGAYFAGNGGNGTSAYSAWGLATGTGENVSGTVYYAGGGGGSAYDNTRTAGTAGYGGGGQGSSVYASGPFNGTANTGGGAGGGGGSSAVAGGAGGSGLVIIRYAI